MKVLPKLNLNKHPEEVENGSLIDALNVIVSKDNSVLQTEPKLLENDVTSCLEDIINGESLYNILYYIPCNEEIVLFVHFPINPNIIKIYRYNEKYKEAKYCTDTDYNRGNIIGTFTYNFNNLIIAFSEYSEYGDKNYSPLKTINLGSFTEGFSVEDIEQLENPSLHPICPEVIIPTIKTNYVYGNTYKGWYFIFVRYKISNNTYTQWFNTNKVVLVDIASEQYIEKYALAYSNNYDTSENLIKENNYATATISDNISSDLDLSTVSIQCKTNNIDKRYKKFQYGFIIVSKSYTKAFRSVDINTDTDTFSVAKNNLIEYNAKDLINTYENYYNVKTLVNNNNRLYIGNYKEDNFLDNLNINTNFTFTFSCSNVNNVSKVVSRNNDGYTGNIIRNIWCNILDKEYNIPVNIFIENNIIKYVTANLFDLKYFYGVSGRNNTSNDSIKNFGITNVNDIITIEYNVTMADGTVTTTQKTTNVSNVYYQGNVDTGLLSHSFVIKNNPFNITVLGNNFKIVKVNGKNIVYSENKKTLDYIVPLIGNSGIYIWNLPDISDIIENETEPDIPIPIEPDEPDEPSEDDIINSSTINGQYIINCTNILPNEKYAFYIHFVNKYGKVSKGYNLSNFGKIETVTNEGFISNAKGYYNKNNNCIIQTPIPNKDNYTNPINLIVSFNIDDDVLEKLKGYGWFISYEKLDKTNIHKGIVDRDYFNSSDTKTTAFYCDGINFEDTINIEFNTICLVNNRTFPNKTNDTNFNYINDNYSNSYIDYKIIDKKLFVADSFNNINKSSYINITCDTDIPAGRYIAYLKNTNAGKYEDNNKILIPCTNIIYFESNEQISDIINTNTSFVSTINALIFNDVTYNTTVNAFSKQKPFFGTLDVDTKNVLNAFANYKFKDYIDIPYECIRFNNKPDVKFFPVGGLNTTDENKKAFVKGFIVEAKDTIDLFKMPYMIIGDCYIKSLDYYDINSNIVDNFPKTIRRSNPYQDESTTNKWRQFEIEQYKNINENKGDIIKLISIGYYFIAHTQHSMFLFNGTDTINAEENNIQLKSVDIWNINYKEVATSELGYAGIQKEYSGIVGEFGYIFYDAAAKRFYRYDNGQIVFIDNNIVNFLRKLDGYNAHFVNDKQRDRLIIILFKNLENDIVLSYNYKINAFVSTHLYSFYRGFNTKENTYVLSKVVSGYYDTHNNILQYSNNDFNKASVHIMINTEYFRMKYLEYIIYKLHTVTPKLINDYSPVEVQSTYYAGDKLKVYSEFCDTGLLNITFENPENTINNFMDYAKPYWRYGNWHFNALRNKLIDAINGNVNADECSRIFGNWFVVNIVIEQDKQVEIESIDYKFEDAELI